jgi:hypothetical protein
MAKLKQDIFINNNEFVLYGEIYHFQSCPVKLDKVWFHITTVYFSIIHS